jgi:hypothetical protein
MIKSIALMGVILLGTVAQGAVTVWCENATVKIRTDAKAQATVRPDVKLQAARREVAAFQIALLADGAVAGVRVRCGDLNGTGKISKDHIALWQEHFIDTHSGKFPDPLSPMDSVDLAPQVVQPIYVEIEVPADAKPGKYSGSIEITAADQTIQIPIELTVLDFELPATPCLRTAFGCNDDPIAKFEGVPATSPDFDRLRKAYYELLLSHGISAYFIPADLAKPESDPYLNDPRMTSYQIPYLKDDGELKALTDRLRKEGWFSKGYFYPVDEPSTQDAYTQLDQIAERLKRVVGPDYKLIAPYCANPQFKTDKDLYDFMGGRISMWCGLTSMRDYRADKLETYKKSGQEMWDYVAWIPPEPYANLQIQQPGMHNRILFWQQWKFGVAGLLYWSTDWWANDANGTTDPWHDMATVKWASKDVFGDGSLLYPGKPIGQTGPMPSLRLKIIRQGMQDYDYIRLAANKAGSEKVDAIINSQVKSATEYQQDAGELEKAKAMLAELIAPVR